jgi:hypothetical protein
VINIIIWALFGFWVGEASRYAITQALHARSRKRHPSSDRWADEFYAEHPT